VATRALVSLALLFGTIGASVRVYASESDSRFRTKVFVNAAKTQVLTLEWMDDHVIHFEFTKPSSHKASKSIPLSPLIAEYSWQGPGTFRESYTEFQTSATRTVVKDDCFSVYELSSKKLAAGVCARDLANSWKNLRVETAGVKNIFGLGQIFGAPGDMNADRAGKLIMTKGDYGNGMPSYAGGATGEALFPVVTALAEGQRSFGFVLDNIYKQNWDFTASTWNIGMFGDHLRGFIITGQNPRVIRQRVMALGGKSPVPPRKMFGFWMSEYGYDNWAEMDQRLAAMRAAALPIDGFFLDLQWFGNVAPGSDNTKMGTLRFDDSAFPDAASRIRRYLTFEDIGLIPIEESYVGRALPEHVDLESRGFLAHKCGDPRTASYLTGDVTGNTSEWWGRGGMLDWSNRDAGRYWHNLKRQPLINLGLYAHWLDLGEPEMFDPSSCYAGSGEAGKVRHQDVHNLFSFLWAKSVADGYRENQVSRRPFMMLRSGNFGLQRFGAGMWSGDIGGNLPSLASHIASHENVSWSGIDYYSADVGGFHRNNADGRPLTRGETQENFTQWFANAAWFDVPLRSHVMNLDNDRETSPATIGHVESNRANLLTRYSLIPYYYSLAHQAAITGAPLMEPLAMRFPEDYPSRKISAQRMLGDLMVTAAAQSSGYAVSTRLPAGLWYDFFDGHHEHSSGRVLEGMPLYRDGAFRLPVFARAGAIVPRLGEAPGSVGIGAAHWERLTRMMALDAYVDPSMAESDFDFYEDDGESLRQGSDGVRVTRLTQSTSGLETTVVIKGALGSYMGSQDRRSWKVRVWSPGWGAQAVYVDGAPVALCEAREVRQDLCYAPAGQHGVMIALPEADVRTMRTVRVQWQDESRVAARIHFACDTGKDSSRSYAVYVSGNVESLGQWDPARALPLKPAEYSKGVWTGVAGNLPVGQTVEYKCLRKFPGGGSRGVEWQPGSNRTVPTTGAGGFGGMAYSRWFSR
jgi:alpha-glucosidase